MLQIHRAGSRDNISRLASPAPEQAIPKDDQSSVILFGRWEAVSKEDGSHNVTIVVRARTKFIPAIPKAVANLPV
jgi:hypothetical protein